MHVYLVQISLYKAMTEQPPPLVEVNIRSVEYRAEVAEDDEKLVLEFDSRNTRTVSISSAASSSGISLGCFGD